MISLPIKTTRMRQQFYLFSLALLSVVSFSSCTKSDVITNEQSLEGTWAVTDIRSDRASDFNGDGRTETDIYGSYTTCQRDIVITFDRNGYGQMRQGCNAYWQNVTWRLSNNNRQLDIILPDDQLNLAVSQFSNSTIRGVDQVYVNGNTFNITYTLQRQ